MTIFIFRFGGSCLDLRDFFRWGLVRFGLLCWLGSGSLLASLASAAPVAPVAPGASGAEIVGTVSNAGTGNLLEGARVELPALGRTSWVDRTGRYVMAEVPAGTHELVVTYTGLDPIRREVTVSAGARLTRDFDLTAVVYQMSAFSVSGEREGTAAAITAQRNAENIKNVVAMDTYGNLPNMNATELALRLPGVAGLPGDEVVEGVTIRGMSLGLNTITIDGGMMSSFQAMTRQTRMTAFTGAMFEQLELIKGHTPDKGADSLGGTINFKTRSPLSMREKRRFTISSSARWAPAFTEQIPLRRAHPGHPLLNAAYQEVFSVLGSERNLGVAVNVFYSENVFGNFRTTRDFENTLNTPAYLWDYRTEDNFNNRKQASISAKIDYRLSSHTKLALNLIYNDAFEPARRRYTTRAFTNQTAPNATTSGVIPGYSDRITQVRAVAASLIDVTSTLAQRFQRLRHGDFGIEHAWGPWALDYAGLMSRTRYSIGNDDGALINRVTNVGWTLDRTAADLYPRFLQTAGADITNPANYRPAPTGLSSNKGIQNEHRVTDLRGNLRFSLPVTAWSFKAGGQWRQQAVVDADRRRRWNYVGTTALADDSTIILWDQLKTGRRIPTWDFAQQMKDGEPLVPAWWREDIYYAEMQKYTLSRSVRETVRAGYGMVQGKVGGTGLLAGVRMEETATSGAGWVRARVATTAAQQAADPLGAAQRDYAGTRRELTGSYRKSFPSLHLHRDLTQNLKARLSATTSFGRPPLTNAVPSETPSEVNQTLTVSNPSLLPQTAVNWDAALEYYFEPAGAFSIGWFNKKIKDYIVTGINSGTIATGAGNGYNGDYSGFTLLAAANAGTAYVNGWEFSYVQQLRFLPGLWRGLSVNANGTMLNTHGNFGGLINLGNGQIPRFIPRTGNISLSWRYRAFSTRLLYNFTGDYPEAYSIATIARNRFVMKREIMNVGFAYEVRPNVNLTCDIANLGNAPQKIYRGVPDQLDTEIIQGTTVTVGVQGRF